MRERHWLDVKQEAGSTEDAKKKTARDLVEHWTLVGAEPHLVAAKHRDTSSALRCC